MVRPMTLDALASSFGGESMAQMRYVLFADKAEQEGFPNVAKLFRAIAYAERVHANNHFNALSELKGDLKVVAGATFGPGTTSKNLELAIMGEEYEVAEMYPAYIAIAELQGERRAVTSFKWALEAEKIHAELFRRAKEYVDRGEDYPLDGKVWICPVCGHTHVGPEPPERCPVCSAPGERYVGY